MKEKRSEIRKTRITQVSDGTIMRRIEPCDQKQTPEHTDYKSLPHGMRMRKIRF